MESHFLKSIHLARGIASVLVAWIHAVQFFPDGFDSELFDGKSSIVIVGGLGVDLFFIISGFVIALNVNNNIDYKRFICSRVVRLVPVYWLYTFAFYIAMLCFAKDYLFIPTELLYSLLFIPYENQFGAVQPILSVGWSLNYEMLFYVSVGLLMFMNSKKFYLFLPLIFIGAINFHYDVIIFEFLLGTFLFYLYNKRCFLNTCLALAFLVASPVVILMFSSLAYGEGGVSRLLIWGCGGAMFLYSVLHFENHLTILPKPVFRYLYLMGTVSYTLYLSHWFVGFVSYRFLDFLPASLQVSMTFLLMLVIAVPLYFILEKPIIGYMKRLIK
ncbi:acyltransferase family protein [Vibrio vulnificus]|uniref:acyltransferase family protein n=1 Tax=Vibrio vulnificus TaxID=672 RepID=UPI0018F7E4B4|nr:acyltransferase [Vibrio vulnificus]